MASKKHNEVLTPDAQRVLLRLKLEFIQEQLKHGLPVYSALRDAVREARRLEAACS